MKLPIASLLMATAVAAAAQEVPVVREGAYWVGTVGGVFAMGVQSRLQVNTRGNVVVKRGTGDVVTYRVQQRVMAANEDQARAMLGGGGTQINSTRGRLLLQIQPISARVAKTDIEIGVPPQVSSVIVQTELGGIDVAEFDGAVQLSTGGGDIQLGKIGGRPGPDAARELAQLVLGRELLRRLQLAPRDSERVHCDERPELRAVIGRVRQHLLREELEHRLDQFGGIGTVGRAHAARSIRSSSSYSISAAMRPSTAYSTLRSCPFR